MKFEQAFYTREDIVGLHVVASSCKDKSFISKCERVGANFVAEPSDRTAEFVYYSRDFRRYVGVGISPSSYQSHNGINKLVHIYVPQKDSVHPEDYYLSYEFDRRVDKNSSYISRDFLPELQDGDFDRIISKYRLDQDQLAMFIYKGLQVALNIKKFLPVVIPYGLFSVPALKKMARDLTWLIYKLIPLPDAYKEPYRKNLSYSLFSENNISSVNIAYICEDTSHKNTYIFGEKAGREVSPLFFELAKRALISKEEYDHFVRELFLLRPEDNTSLTVIENAYLSWRLQNSRVKLAKEELPLDFYSLIHKAQDMDSYRYLLYRAVPAITNLTDKDLKNLANSIFWPVIRQIPQESYGDEFFTAYKSAALYAFHTNYRTYQGYVKNINPQLKKRLVLALWEDGSEKSCILIDLKRIETVEEALDRLALYQDLKSDSAFAFQMRKLMLHLYFNMEEMVRSFVSETLGSNPDEKESAWNAAINRRISYYFSQPSWETFFVKEIKDVEERFVPVYFSYYLRNCQDITDYLDQEKHLKLGLKFLNRHEKDLDAPACQEFRNLKKNWTRNILQHKLKILSLEDLAAFYDFGDTFEEDKYAILKIWAEEVIDRLNEISANELPSENIHDRNENELPSETINGRNGNKLSSETITDQIIDRLVRRADELKEADDKLVDRDLTEHDLSEDKLSDRNLTEHDLSEDKLSDHDLSELNLTAGKPENDNMPGAYMDAVWKACAFDLRYLIFASYCFGVREYSVWSCIGFADPDSYECIYNAVNDQSAFKDIENTDIESAFGESAELNRICYILWKRSMQNKLLDFDLLSKFNLQEYKDQMICFLRQVLQKDLLSYTDLTSCINYMQIDIFLDKFCGDSDNTRREERFSRYKGLKTFENAFYKALLKCLSYGTDRNIKDRLDEIKLFEKMDSSKEQ